MKKCKLFVSITVRDPNGGKVLALKDVGLEFGMRRVDEMMEEKYGQKVVRRRDAVVIPPLIDLYGAENAP